MIRYKPVCKKRIPKFWKFNLNSENEKGEENYRGKGKQSKKGFSSEQFFPVDVNEKNINYIMS